MVNVYLKVCKSQEILDVFQVLNSLSFFLSGMIKQCFFIKSFVFEDLKIFFISN